MKLSNGWRKALLSLHIATTVSVLGTDLVLLLLTMSNEFSTALLVGENLVAPLAVASLATGLLLALLGPYGLLRYWWTTIKLAITAALTGAIYLALLPALRTAAAGGAQPATLVLAPSIAIALLLVNVVFAVFKPAARLSRPAMRAPEPKEMPT